MTDQGTPCAGCFVFRILISGQDIIQKRALLYKISTTFKTADFKTCRWCATNADGVGQYLTNVYISHLYLRSNAHAFLRV